MEREILDMDILFVGSGPASLSGAYHLARLIRDYNQKIESGALQGDAIALENGIGVLEKSANAGDHMLSGAVMDPIAIRELFPDYKERSFPIESEVTKESIYQLTGKSKIKFPFLPKNLNNHGTHICSLNKISGWLAEQINKDFGDAVNVFNEFPGREILTEGKRVIGVRTGDKGLDHHGQPKSNFETGADIHAKITILGEGPRGSLTKHIVPQLSLDKDRNPQIYGTGVKELWEIPAGRLQKGAVIHTAGWPLTSKQYGGTWIYMMSDTLCSIGFVAALDYENPTFDPHNAFSMFKTHPFISEILKDGKMTSYGAKTVSEGGYWSMPKLYADGLMLIGESGGFINISRLKGIHLSMKSGMLAAEAAFTALKKNDFTESTLKTYDDLFRQSWAHKELWTSRNYRQNFTGSIKFGMMKAGMQMYLTGGGTKKQTELKPDYIHMKKIKDAVVPIPKVKFDEKLTFTKLTDVYYSGSTHEENQPCHLVIIPEDVANICNTKCKEEYGNPCQHFCPAQVYEMVAPEEGQPTRLKINFTNCVHCKTCDIADPYQVINWVTPEGGGGPVYKDM
jgi:electron-transferring-flavoprotein dehydrogenase